MNIWLCFIDFVRRQYFWKCVIQLLVFFLRNVGIPTKSTVCPFCTEKFGTNKLLRAHIKDAHREQQLIGEEQCAKSLEGLHQDMSSKEGHEEMVRCQEGLDLSSRPDSSKFKSPGKSNTDCPELVNAGQDFRLHICSWYSFF